MSKQIAVRLPEELVEFLDQLVAEGAPSRASVVTLAIERERRYRRTLVDLAILGSIDGDPYPDLEGFVGHASAEPLDID